MSPDTSQLSRDQLLAMFRLQTDIARLGLNISNILDLVTERSMALTGADGSVIELTDKLHMVYRATAGIARSQLGLRIPVQGSLSGLCSETGNTLRCDDASTDPRVDRASCERIGLNALLVVPLRHGDHTIGVLKVLSKQKKAFSEADEVMLTMLSDMVASAMFYATEYNFEELFYRATHDQMTGLANRALFLDHMHSALAQARRHQSLTGILMIDMNDLKQINDNFGHLSGDAAICEFARRLRQKSRASDTVARFGGDEFGMILTPITLKEDIDLKARRLERQLQQEFHHNNDVLPLSASIGGAVYPHDGRDLESLLEKADRQMYARKRALKQNRS
ncbi:sensor domain-containing diguanylate cyclase [Methylophaga sp.]|jgi:diguanylate cyclase (GGDEF)-like protein|uniref:sensor domain-containing diguanylate cyclase n=1 Tax=Methylophaga sp. TaxID=2024840 RepID=UPI0025CFD91E|nr:sensor domain-containing diguanylate cyclase [Methylophaga sp.]